jgi:RimJ/RimL family protein N-acetyltransferase
MPTRELAYAVHPWARGQGVAVEAVRLICDVLRTDEIGARAAIRVEPENSASVRVAQKAGFRYVRDFPSKSRHSPGRNTPTTFSLYFAGPVEAQSGDGHIRPSA